MKKFFALASLTLLVTASALAGDFYECNDMRWGGGEKDQHHAKIRISMDPPRAQYSHDGSVHDLTYQSTWEWKSATPPETVMDFVSSAPDFPHFHLSFYMRKKAVALASVDWQGFLDGNCELAKPWEN